jgi:hypothetical protein
MAQSDAKQLYVQSGTVYGETPGTWLGSHALQVFDLSMQPLQAEAKERTQIDAEGEARIVKPAMTALFGTLEFSTYALCSGTAGTAPATAPLFAACGMTQATVTGVSNTFSLASLNSATGFAHFMCFWGGDRYFFYNARGSCKATYTAGELPVYQWSFEGFYVPPFAEAVIAPTYPTTALDVTIDAANTGVFTIGATGSPISMEFTSFTFDLGNTIARIDNGGGAASKRVIITSRTLTASATVRHTAHATFNPFALAATEAELALKLVHGPAAGRKQTIEIPRFTLPPPGSADPNNEMFWELALNISRSANLLNPLTIKFD